MLGHLFSSADIGKCINFWFVIIVLSSSTGGLPVKVILSLPDEIVVLAESSIL